MLMVVMFHGRMKATGFVGDVLIDYLQTKSPVVILDIIVLKYNRAFVVLFWLARNIIAINQFAVHVIYAIYLCCKQTEIMVVFGRFIDGALTRPKSISPCVSPGFAFSHALATYISDMSM